MGFGEVKVCEECEEEVGLESREAMEGVKCLVLSQVSSRLIIRLGRTDNMILDSSFMTVWTTKASLPGAWARNILMSVMALARGPAGVGLRCEGCTNTDEDVGDSSASCKGKARRNREQKYIVEGERCLLRAGGRVRSSGARTANHRSEILPIGVSPTAGSDIGPGVSLGTWKDG